MGQITFWGFGRKKSNVNKNLIDGSKKGKLQQGASMVGEAPAVESIEGNSKYGLIGNESKKVLKTLDDLPKEFSFHHAFYSASQDSSKYSKHCFLISGGGKNFLVVNALDRKHPAVIDCISNIRSQNIPFEILDASPDLIKILGGQFLSFKEKKIEQTGFSNIEKLAADIIEEAIEKGASDIHIEVRTNTLGSGGLTEVFFRIYGCRILTRHLPEETGVALAGIYYDVMADNRSKGVKWQDDRPLDTVIMYHSRSDQPVQIRFASAPIFPSGSFQIVMRILVMDHKKAISLPEVGYLPQQMKAIEQMLIGSQGLVLLVGPTNSGKSTSMQSMTKRILDVRGRSIKIETIEDPVEYIIPGAAQMPVAPNASFNDLLKSTLRHDPDVLIVGEIRDAESAEAVKNIVLAGRKVLATLHVYEAMAAFSRLLEIGVPKDVLFMKGFISGIIYQRLLPLLCDCAYDWHDAIDHGIVPDDLVERVHRVMITTQYTPKVHNPNGCPKCEHRVPGYRGRTVVAEAVIPDERILDALREGHQEIARSLWQQTSELDTGFGITALGHALFLFAQGKVDARDIEAQVQIIHNVHNAGFNENIGLKKELKLENTKVGVPHFEESSSAMSEEGLLGAIYES